MATPLLFRDATDRDLSACLELDHMYETEYVWQMRIHNEGHQQQITFQRERLPRFLDAEWPINNHRLQLALPPEHCFLIAEDRENHEVIGYLTMRHDPIYGVGRLQDVVVSRPHRRQKIGTRLMNVARQWAVNKQIATLTAELQTQNFPGILFCQASGLSFCGFNDHYFPNQDIAVFFSETLR